MPVNESGQPIMRIYEMLRNEDETGNSGTGIVAEVVEFSDGTAVLHWSATTNALGVTSTALYGSLDDLIRVHGHGGKTVLIPIYHLPPKDAP
ncbi:MAG TPA: hypothetical protein VKE41_07470 [Roseiflexaceae bacterium]|nr:hypothetical protein [Roseiflexaceae bacterium]